MAKHKKDPIREDRIENEAIVDAYGPEEQALGWYYYLENKIRFPFQAKCIVAKAVSPLRKGETVEVQRLAPEDACSSDMLVLIRWQGRKMAVPLSQLTALDADESTTRGHRRLALLGIPRLLLLNHPQDRILIYARLPKAHVNSQLRRLSGELGTQKDLTATVGKRPLTRPRPSATLSPREREKAIARRSAPNAALALSPGRGWTAPRAFPGTRGTGEGRPTPEPLLRSMSNSCCLPRGSPGISQLLGR